MSDRKEISFNDLREANSQRGIEWEGKANTIDNLDFTAIEMGGEAGELLEAVQTLVLSSLAASKTLTALDGAKKLMRNLRGMPNKNRTREDCLQLIKDELGDSIITIDRFAESLGIDLGEIVQEKFNKTSKQNGFQTLL